MPYDVPDLTALAMAAGGLLLAVSCLLSRVGAQFCVPVSLLFLAVGMLAGCDGPGGIQFREFPLAHAVATTALAAVLFSGGLQTNLKSIAGAVAPATLLATVGVLGIAGLTALGCHAIGLHWPEACLIGAIVASTDASAVFTVLAGVKLPKRVASTIELESGLNDPMAVILTFAMTAQLLGEPLAPGALAWQVVQQLVLGVTFGLAVGWTARTLLVRVPLHTPALTPVLTLGCALVAFGAPAFLGGSGFLSVYLAGIVVGNAPHAQQKQLVDVHESLSWLGQVSMFLLLGLLVNPSDLPHVALYGVAITLLLAFVARPISVFLCLIPFRFHWREKLFIALAGLRGAVPIVLATVPVLRAQGQTQLVVEALDVFDIVFFVVVVSALIPGATVVHLARWLQLDAGAKAAPAPSEPARAAQAAH